MCSFSLLESKSNYSLSSFPLEIGVMHLLGYYLGMYTQVPRKGKERFLCVQIFLDISNLAEMLSFVVFFQTGAFASKTWRQQKSENTQGELSLNRFTLGFYMVSFPG